MGMHLDPGKHAALLAGTLAAAEARALARHLAEGCERCEGYLASRPEADALDGRVDRALLALGPGAAEERGVVRLPAAAAPARTPARRLRAPALAAAVLVAGLAGLAAILARGPERPAWDGTKGAAQAGVPVRLRFVIVEGGGALRRAASGATVSAAARLEFEVELGAAAHVALLRVAPGGGVDPFFSGPLGPGASRVELHGRPAAYALEGLAGRQRFVAVASPAPLGGEAAARAARAAAGAPGAGGAIAEGVTADAVEVRIE